MNLSVYAEAADDQVSTTLNWGNDAQTTYSGRLSAVANFIRTEGEKRLLKTSVDIRPTEILLNDTLWNIHPSQVVIDSGKSAVANFIRTEGEKRLLKTSVDIRPTEILLNDTLWNIHPSQVVIDSGKVNIHNFYFSHQDRHVRVNGTLSSLPEDSVKIDLKDINMGYVFDIANISDDVNFEGDASGTAYACGVLQKPVMNTRLFVKNFSLNHGRLGDLDIYGEWDNDHRGIRLDASIHDADPTPSRVTGIIYPLKPESGLDLQIDAHSLNLKFLEHYMSSIATDIQGRGTGKVHFYGKFKGLNLDGAVMTDASMKFDILNARFAVKDTIHLAPTGLDFKHMHIADMEGHPGTLNGYLHFKHFKDLHYHFNIEAHNMLVMNTKESSDMPFYGTVYGTGNVSLSGDATRGLEVNAAMTTNRNTVFTYINGSVASATSNQFIKFVDKTPRRTVQDSVQLVSYFEKAQQQYQEEETEQETDIRLNILVDATPDASMRIIMDPIAGDYIHAKGNGNIRTEFYNKGDVRMFGNYNITQGVYKFSLQEVIRKDFVIKDGSTITFNGAPLDANMDIQASYTVNSASLNDLIPSLQEVIRKDFVIKDGSTITFNGAPLDANMDIQASYTVNSASLNDLIPDESFAIQQPNVRVNCIMNLSGMLVRPSIKLGIELPNERDEVQTLVRNYISTEEQMNMQILYLLGIGKFYTEDARNNNHIELPNERDEVQTLVRNYISTEEQMNMQILYLLGIGKFYTEDARNNNQNSNVMSSVLSSTLSGQLNNALSQVFETNNWNIGTNLSTGDKGWTDVENSNVMSSVLSSTLSGQLNNALSQVFETNNWNIGTNLSTGDKGWTDVEVEGILSGQLLNNRLLINGNFGYRDNPMANTNFVGDFEAEWLLTRSGDVRLKAYNETNDRYYTKTNLTTQGVGIVYKKDFEKWRDLFFWNNWKKIIQKRKKEKAAQKNQ